MDGQCLHGNNAQAGPCSCLTQQFIPYDIAHLFKRSNEVQDMVTISALNDEVYNVTHLDFDPSNQYIFGSLDELQRVRTRSTSLFRGRTSSSLRNYIRSRLIRAAHQLPVLKAVIDHIIIQPEGVVQKQS